MSYIKIFDREYINDYIVENLKYASVLKSPLGRTQHILKCAVYAALNLNNERVFCDTQMLDGELSHPAYNGYIDPQEEFDSLHSWMEDNDML